MMRPIHILQTYQTWIDYADDPAGIQGTRLVSVRRISQTEAFRLGIVPDVVETYYYYRTTMSTEKVQCS